MWDISFNKRSKMTLRFVQSSLGYLRGAQILGKRLPRWQKCCTDTLNIWGSSAWSLLHVTVPVPRILRWFLDIWKICAPLMYLILDIVCSEMLWLSSGQWFPNLFIYDNPFFTSKHFVYTHVLSTIILVSINFRRT